MNKQDISRIYLILIKVSFLGLMWNVGAAQEMKVISSKTVEIKGQRIPYQNLHERFEPIPGGSFVYNNSLISDKKARSTGYTTLGLIGGGVLLALVDNREGPCDNFCFTTGQVIGFLSVTVGGSIVGTAALITRAKAAKRQRQAVDLCQHPVYILV